VRAASAAAPAALQFIELWGRFNDSDKTKDFHVRPACAFAVVLCHFCGA
jgi:hypothetical protein